MARVQLILCSVALAALLPAAACSSHGRVAMNGGAGIGDGGGQAEQPPGDGNPPNAAPTLDGTVGETAGTVLAAAGNLGVPGSGDGGPVGEATGALDALARVSVDGQSTGGDGNGNAAIGVSAASATQTQGDTATLGVLANGQVLSADASGTGAAIPAPNGQGDLIAANANDDQVIGDGQSQAIGAGVLTSNNASGDIASVNALTGGQTANAQVNGVTTLSPNTSVVDQATDALGNLLDSGG